MPLKVGKGRLGGNFHTYSFIYPTIKYFIFNLPKLQLLNSSKISLRWKMHMFHFKKYERSSLSLRISVFHFRIYFKDSRNITGNLWINLIQFNRFLNFYESAVAVNQLIYSFWKIWTVFFFAKKGFSPNKFCLSELFFLYFSASNIH